MIIILKISEDYEYIDIPSTDDETDLDFFTVGSPNLYEFSGRFNENLQKFLPLQKENAITTENISGFIGF